MSRRLLASAFLAALLVLSAAALAEASGEGARAEQAPAGAGEPSRPSPEEPPQAPGSATEPRDEPGSVEGELQRRDAGAAERQARRAPRRTLAPARMRIRVTVRGHRVEVGRRIRIKGLLWPFVRGERIVVLLRRGGRVIGHQRGRVRRLRDTNIGFVQTRSRQLIEPGRYRAEVFHRRTRNQRFAADRSQLFGVHYPDLDPGDRGGRVLLLNRLLERRAYHTARSSEYGPATGRAVMAFRKVNGMRRSFNAIPAIFRDLAAGEGGFRLRHPGAGRHVETDISRQVMVLADEGEARHIFHISSGAPATPTVRGKFHFYRRQPGYNSLRMYHSVYFHGGYAIHGYHSVPPYPASHGCLRNPIPDARFIYDWVRIGMPIYVYG